MKLSVFKRALPALACCLLAVLALALVYRFDNKYTAMSPVSQDGAVALDADALEGGALVIPADGWQLWPDALLTPGELETAGLSPVETYIGQSLTLRPWHADGSPYGCATWRLRLTASRPVTVSLLIPEAYCASAVWADGAYLGGAGSVEPYAPRVMDGVYAFPVQGETELVVQTANYTHYYSGLTFPPVVGSPTAVARYAALRMALYGLLCFTALAVALFSSAVWLGPKGRRDPLYLWFGALCLAYGARVCYPFLRAAGVPLIRPLYALEDLGAFLLLYCAARMVCRLFGWEDRRWARCVLFPLSLAMCAAGVVFPCFLLPRLPAVTAAYGLWVSWYALGMAAVLLCLSLRGSAAKGGLVRCGLGVFAVTQAASVLWNGPFEPIRGAWPEEYGGFVLVLCFAALMVRRSHALAAENLRLTDRLQEEVDRQTEEIGKMVEERRTILSGKLHDLKSPVALVQNYAILVRENDVLLDGEQRMALDLIVEKCRDLGERMREIQALNAGPVEPVRLEPLDLTDLLRRFYALNRPDVEVGDVDFLLRVPEGPCRTLADAARVERILENLVYNAASFTPPGGRITLSLDRERDRAVLAVEDTGPGIRPEDLPLLFERGFTTRAKDGGQGLGLAIVREAAQAMGGRAEVSSEPGRGSRFQVTLPLWA